MIIDFHTHCYPDKIASRAIDAVGPLGLECSYDGTISGLCASMKTAGIDLALNLPLVNSPENTRGVNAWAAKNNSAPVFSLGSIHPDDPAPDKTLAWIKSLGLKGVKMHPEYQSFSFDETRLEPIWEACIEQGLFLLTHAGRDIAFEPPSKSDPASLAAFHHRFPDLTLVLAHMGSWGLWDEVERHLAGLPVYLDMSFVPGLVDDALLVKLIRLHGSDRVLFGTDAPWRDQRECLRKVRELDLTAEEYVNITCKNAAALLGLA